MSDNSIYHIFQDSHGRLWVATGGGLNLFNPNAGTFTCWNESKGLSNNFNLGILEDSHGNLWMSVAKGINKFNPETEKFTWYDKGDGLQDNEFNQWSFMKDRNGNMYFGGSNGVSVFHPDSIKDDTTIPPVVVTGFQLFNKPVTISDTTVLKNSLSQTKNFHDKCWCNKFVYHEYTREIILMHQENVFAFEFSALNYRQPEKNKFAYKLEPFNKDWIYTDYKDRKAVFTNIPPGEYVFRVKASNDDGYWNEEGASVNVIILPPWWLTWWAKTMWAVLVVGFLTLAYRVRTSSLKAQRRRLQLQVEERTKELKSTNEELNSTVEELNSTVEELNTSNENLNTTFNQLLVLDQYKESMTAMIVHDFKNSLNTVISFSEGTPTERRLKSIRQAGQFMLNMVLNILDLQKFESASVKLSLANYAVNKLVSEAVDQLSYLIEQKAIKLTYEPTGQLYCRVDHDLTVRVIVNILSNAIKYVPQNGTIDILATRQNDFVRIAIRDNGIGIPADKIHLVFEKYVQINAQKSGSVRSTGIGLTFCKMVVESIGGTIGAESEEGAGSTFYFTLPFVNEDLSQAQPSAPLVFLNEQVIVLSDEEQVILKPWLEKLRQWEVYDYSEIVSIMEKIENSNGNIVSWKERLLRAVQTGNEEQFSKLLNNKK